MAIGAAAFPRRLPRRKRRVHGARLELAGHGVWRAVGGRAPWFDVAILRLGRSLLFFAGGFKGAPDETSPISRLEAGCFVRFLGVFFWCPQNGFGCCVGFPLQTAHFLVGGDPNMGTSSKGCGCQNRFGIPFWGFRCTTQF